MPSGRRRRQGRAQSSSPPSPTTPPPQLTSSTPPPPPSRPQLTSPAFHDTTDLPSSAGLPFHGAADIPSSAGPAFHGAADIPSSAGPAFHGAADIPSSAGPAFHGAADIPSSAGPAFHGADHIPSSAVPAFHGAAHLPSYAVPAFHGAAHLPSSSSAGPAFHGAAHLPSSAGPAFHDAAHLPSSTGSAIHDADDLPSYAGPASHDTALLLTAHLQATSVAASTAEQIRPVADVLRESERGAAVTLHEALPPAPQASPPTGHDDRESEPALEETSSSSMPQTTRFKVPDLFSLNLDINLLADACISTLVPTGLMIKYFVRVDNDGIFHTYPDRGGPFESIQEVQEAIDSHHAVQRKNICMDGLSDEERAIRYALYWYHDGTRKHSKEAFVSCTTDLPTEELIKAVLDKYNEENGLVGDLAYELDDIVSHNSCFDGKDCIYRSYDHFNLTLKTKGAASNDLYFAEVTCMNDYEVYVLTYFCMVTPEDNGECHVCGAEMKHPAHDGYNRGRPHISHSRRRALGGPSFEKLFDVRDEAWLKEEEDRVRRMIIEGKEERRKSEVEHGIMGKYVIPSRRPRIKS